MLPTHPCVLFHALDIVKALLGVDNVRHGDDHDGYTRFEIDLSRTLLVTEHTLVGAPFLEQEHERYLHSDAMRRRQNMRQV